VNHKRSAKNRILANKRDLRIRVLSVHISIRIASYVSKIADMSNIVHWTSMKTISGIKMQSGGLAVIVQDVATAIVMDMESVLQRKEWP
jgi:hypothetical protein